jgi:histone-binding protein RBBP4
LEKEYAILVSSSLSISLLAALFITGRLSPCCVYPCLTPILDCRYDVVMTHALEWPSLTCQWLPTVRNAGENASEHSLLLGTHTTGEQNYLMVASCSLPKEDTVVDSDSQTKESSNSAAVTTISTANYDEEKKEMGGFGHASSNIGKIEIRMKVKHQGEVNRARIMPQNHFIVATRGPDPEVYVFDLSKHPSFPEEGSAFSPQAVCMGHSKEGYGISWSKLKEGYLLSGSEDTTLCLWDIMAGAKDSTEKSGRQVHPLNVFKGHTDVVEDVDWHAKDPNMMGSVSDDRTIRIWDIRDPQKAVHVVENAHEGDVNCIAFNPNNEFIFATGSADKTVALWDLRNLKS